MTKPSSFGFARPKDSPGFLLWQTTMSWQRLIKKALEPHAISHAQFVIMALLLWHAEHDAEVTQVIIINGSKLDKMTVSSSLKKLSQLGFVTRKEHGTDTRAKQVTLTAQGKTLVRKLVPIVENIDADFFGQIPEEQQKSLQQSLAHLITPSHKK